MWGIAVALFEGIAISPEVDEDSGLADLVKKLEKNDLIPVLSGSGLNGANSVSSVRLSKLTFIAAACEINFNTSGLVNELMLE